MSRALGSAPRRLHTASVIVNPEKASIVHAEAGRIPTMSNKNGSKAEEETANPK